MVRYPHTLFVLALVVVPLAGCLGAEEEPVATADETAAQPEGVQSDDADPVVPEQVPIEVPAGAIPVRIPVGAFDPTAELDWYQIDDPVVPAGQTLFFINDDTVYHRVLGLLTPSEVPDEPAWADGSGHGGHGHEEAGGHEEGGHAEDGAHADDDGHEGGHGEEDHGHGGETVFDIELQAGETAEVVLEGDGALVIHCHPHPWMESDWVLRPAAPVEYPLFNHTLVFNGSTEGGLALGHGAEDRVETPVNVTIPNLLFLEAEVTWDDSADDGPLGADGNGADTLTVRLVSPQGWVVAEQTQTARQGDITVRFNATGMDWSDTLLAQGLDDAARILEGLGSSEWVGQWTVQTILDAAPGYFDDGGEMHDAPHEAGFDGAQGFQLAILGVHQYATLSGPASTTSAEYHLEGAAHEH